MRKRRITLFILCIIVTQSIAQKIKTESVNASLIHYPIVPLPESFTTYNVITLNKGLDTKEFKVENPEEKIRLQNFKHIKEKSDVNITIIIGKLYLSPSLSPSSRINSLDELRGQSEDYMVNFSIRISYEINDRRGILIKSEVLTQNNGFQTTELTTETGINVKAVNINKEITYFVDKSIARINNRIRDLFDTYRETYNCDLYFVKPSKTNKYAPFTTAFKTIENAFKDASTDKPNLQNALSPSLDFWETSLNTFDINSEESKPYYFLCAYNLSLAYLLLDDFDKSFQFLDKVNASNYKQAHAIHLNNEIIKRKNYKDKYLKSKEIVNQNLNVIYQKSEVIDIPPDGFFGAFKKENLVGELEFMTKGFIINASGDSVFGEFIEFEKNKSNGKIFFVPKGKDQVVYNHPYVNLRQVSTTGILYYCAKGLRRVIYASPKLVVMGEKHNVIFRFPDKDGKGVFHAVDPNDGASYMTNFARKFADVFTEVCPSVSEKSLNGMYDLKQTDTKYLMAPIKDFELQCGSNEYEKYKAMLDEAKVIMLYK